MTTITELLKTCNLCLTKPCTGGHCPHGIERQADIAEYWVMGLGYAILEREEVEV